MLNNQTINDLHKAFEGAPGGFLVVDSGRPSFAVLPYQIYQKLKSKATAKKNIKRILVTGGAGYIGSTTVKILLDRGYEVVVFDNLSTGRAEAVSCKLIVGDLADREALDKVFEKERIDAVVHFAASIEVEESVHNPAKYYQNNVVNGLNLLDAMARHRVNKIVFSSTGSVYGNPEKLPITEDTPCRPTNPYAETKMIFENILKWYGQAYGIDSVSLRYFNAAGAWAEQGLGYSFDSPSHLIPRVLDVALGKNSEVEVYGQDYATPDGTCIRDYVHILDLADAHELALKKLENASGAFTYNAGTGLGSSVLEVIDAAMEVTGHMIAMKSMPRRAGDPEKHVADATLLQKEFGWKPKHDLRSIIESSWSWHKKTNG